MSLDFPSYDAESDRLVSVLVDPDASAVQKRRASEQLYRRHSEWVIDRIGLRIYNPADIQDIAQVAWMMVLDIKVLQREYVRPEGKFRAYLRKPIHWAIGKHMDKLPYTLDEHGQKQNCQFTGLDDSLSDDALVGHRLYQMIETVIKPNLKNLGLKVRNVYLLNEHDILFDTPPSLPEIADINGISEGEGATLLYSSSEKSPAQCDDDEFSIRVPMNYDTIVDRAELDRNSTVYFADIMDITPAAYRKRLHNGRQLLIQTVRSNLLLTSEMNHG